MSNPSLILPQSPAYGEDYVYAAQVEDGAVPLYNVLPLTFTRASGGTRINKDGLVQNMPYNLLQYSEDFTNGYWSTSLATITANSTIAPNGTTTADTFTRTSGTAYLFKSSLNLGIGEFTQSVYAKANASSLIRLEFVTSGFGRGAACIFDLSNGTAGTLTIYGGVSGFTANIESVGNGWYRCSIGGTLTIADTYFWELSITSGSIYIWGAQLNIGSTAQPYLATTDRLNMPRITYPVGGGCGALLLEPQRTNLVLYSEQFDNADWSKIGSTITANATISPDGTQNADKLIEDTSTGNHRIVNTAFAVNNGNAHSQSWYVKYFNNQWIQLNRGQEGSGYLNFDLINGVVGYTGGITDYQISNMANGWYRISINYVVTGTYATAGISILDTNVNARYESYVGDGTSGVYIWGCQYEQSSYPTSYIPTTSSSATRVADACYKTGISNLIGQTEGVIFVDYVLNGQTNSANIFNCEKNTTCSLFMAQQLDGNFDAGLYVSGSLVGRIEAGSISIGQRVKVAYAYKSGSFALYINGVQEGILSSTFTFPTTLDDIFLNDETYFNYKEAVQYNQVSLFKTRLTNAELATLTTI